MELVRQYQRPSATSVVIFRFPWYVTIALFMLTGITVIVIGVVTAAHHEMTNPFSVVRDLLGEDARQAALARGFTCQDTWLPSHPMTIIDYCTCTHCNPDKLFSGLYVRMTGSSADEIRFSLRDNPLTLGDLAVLWGKPKIRLYCETVVASWPARHIVAIIAPSQTGQRSYFSPIISVYFTRNGLSHFEPVLMNDALRSCGGVRDVTLGLHSDWSERKP